MALNLNKGGEENSKPSTEKKGLNLSKSGDEVKTGLNLSKEKTVSNETTSAKSGANETSPKKKNQVIVVLLAVLVVGGGLFWFLNKGTTPEQTSNMKGDNAVSSAPAKIEETASADNTTNNQGQDSSVNPSTAASSDNSVSSSPESNVSASSNNITNSNNGESSKSTSSKNESAKSTSSASVITPVGSIDEKVSQVLRGDFGNGLERKRALGDEYAVIQAKVNELYRNKND